MTKSLVIVLAALSVTASISVAQSLSKVADDVFVTEKVEGDVAMSPGQRLVINAATSLGGDIILRAGGQRCRYSCLKRLKTPAKAEAAEYAGAISVEVESQKDAVTFSLRAPARVPWAGTNNSGRLEIEISIPDSCPVECNTAYFDIDAAGPFAEFVVTESLSKATVENVIGLLDIKVSNRPLTIKNVSGQVTATNKYGRIKLENIDTHENLGTIRNEHGEIIIDAFRGSLDVRTSYDRIVAQNMFLTGTRNRFKNISGLISLSFDSLTIGKVRANNQYGPITLNIDNRVDAQFICKIGSDGEVLAENMEMVPTLVDENRLEFVAGEKSAEVRLTIRESGDIVINGPD